jgi:hypothetical protein
VRRAGLWALLAAKLITVWGVAWDIQWHLLIGRDSFWIAPHLLTYAGVTVAVITSFGVLAWDTWRDRWRGRPAAPAAGRDGRRLGVTGTRGFRLAALGITITVLAAPIDDLWHRLFGLDVTLWSPPHLLGILGAAINSLACLAIAREVYPDRTPWRPIATLAAGALFYMTLHLAIEPSMRIAYLYGGVRFYTYTLLAVLILPLALVATARLADTRWAPLAIVLALVPAVALSGRAIEHAGFALLEPVSAIAEEIAKDPAAPIAVAHEIARKNGTAPGRAAGLYTLLGLGPAALMSLLDARRRPAVATAGYAVALLAANGVLLALRPAFRPLVPGPTTTVAALALAVGLALAGARVAQAVTDGLEAAPGRA